MIMIMIIIYFFIIILLQVPEQKLDFYYSPGWAHVDEAATISVIVLNAVKRKLILEQINKRRQKQKG